MQQLKPQVQSENMPEKRFSTGAISATVWQNTGNGQNGPTTFQTVSLQRAYKDKNDEWQHTGNLRVNDLPKAALLLGKAYEYMVLKESPKEAY